MTPPTIAPTEVVEEPRFEELLIPSVEVGAAELEVEGMEEDAETVSIRVVVDRGGAEVTVVGGTLLLVDKVDVVEVLRVVVSQGAKSVATGELMTVMAGIVATTVEVTMLKFRKSS